MEKKRRNEWSKAYPVRPQDHQMSHKYIREKKFVPSYDKNREPPQMSLLLSWEYSRVWLREREQYIAHRNARNARTTKIDNDYTWWLQKRSMPPRKKPKC